MVNLKAIPFNLNDKQIKWVEDTLASMTLEQKCGQLFCTLGLTDNEYYLGHLINDIGIGGIMYRPSPARNVYNTHKKIQEMAKIPLLLAANTECGGNGLASEGTSFGAPLAVSATNDPVNAYKMGYVACHEAAALGLNWSFAPIVDICKDFHNPITNTRTFGSNADMVINCAENYLKGAAENNVVATIKHFPGDGVDERDQHIVTSVNSLSFEDWMNSYGKVYQTLINKGAGSVMVGHIALPSGVKHINPDATKEEMLKPATLSKEVITGILRNTLGFNGLISTDSTAMIGFTVGMPRSIGVPYSIACGCDMFLFNKDIDEDFHYLVDGVKNGIVTEERINEAVTRILATKAALKLNEKKEKGVFVGPVEDALKEVGKPEFVKWADEVADKSITLVKDDQHLLPISPKKYKRLYLNVIQKSIDPDDPLAVMLKKKFEKEGFEVTVRDRRTTIVPSDFDTRELSAEKQVLMNELYRGTAETKKNYDLYVYVVNMQNASNNTTLRLNWNVVFGLGDDAPWLVKEVPVMMISLAYPYHLFDAPMVETYINAYSSDERFIDATIDKVMGRSAFKGVSPIDPRCGKDYI